MGQDAISEVQGRAVYEGLLREELEGVVKRKNWYRKAVLNLGNKTGDWQRDLDRLVETEMHNVQQFGRSEGIIEEHGDDVYVYKDVYPGACQVLYPFVSHWRCRKQTPNI